MRRRRKRRRRSVEDEVEARVWCWGLWSQCADWEGETLGSEECKEPQRERSGDEEWPGRYGCQVT
jgi:hypothetical protein